MTTLAKCAISLVHGARIPPKEPRWFRPDWPERVSRFFVDKGVGCVKPYFWSGDVWDAFSPKAAGHYADHITELHEMVRGPVFIISKSLGFAVAESGLTVLAARKTPILIPRMIRIVPPDGRKRCHIPLVGNVIDFVSGSDLMHIGWTPPITSMIYLSFLRQNSKFPQQKKKIFYFSAPDHTFFNFNNELKTARGWHSMFSMYYQCLFDELDAIDLEQNVISITQCRTSW